MMLWGKKQDIDKILKRIENKESKENASVQNAKSQAPTQAQNNAGPLQFARNEKNEKNEKKPETKKVLSLAISNRWKNFVNYFVISRKDLPDLLQAAEIKETPFEFVQRVIITSMLFTIFISLSLLILFSATGSNPIFALVFAPILFIIFVNYLMMYPFQKIIVSGKEIERDILFAARDMVIALRGGVPLYNAIVSVSRGYGAASQEFSKIVSLVNLGTPLDEAIDKTIKTTKSPSFRRIMLQASTSIKAGTDISSALQITLDQINTERTIELRRYGQKLNALAMFYMIVGVIFPSMLISVAIILSTFISIITIDAQMLVIAFLFIILLQFVFLNLIKNSRPVFA